MRGPEEYQAKCGDVDRAEVFRVLVPDSAGVLEGLGVQSAGWSRATYSPEERDGNWP